LESAAKLVVDNVIEPRRVWFAPRVRNCNMHARYLISAALVSGLLAAATAPAALAAPPEPQATASANWSGYVAQSKSGDGFSSVSASWVEPSANCSVGQGHSSFWVGLGGSGQASQSLEQVGTAADCNAGGSADHYAWYELVPAAPVRLGLAISPGDHLTGQVSVEGTAVTVSLADATTGQSATKTLEMNNPDASSAEWIAEAPSSCDQTGNCTPLPLADFGAVQFSHASATSSGHTGTISDPLWTMQPVALSAGSAESYPQGFVSDQTSGGAQPSGLSTGGSAFSVSYVGSATGSPATVSSGSGPSTGFDPTGASVACVPTSDGWVCGYVLG
jgi:peptidase A4-like protein